MEIARQEPDRREQLDGMLEDRPFLPAQPWFEVASFAAYCVQGEALRLKLWQSPPCSFLRMAKLAIATSRAKFFCAG